MDDVEGNAVIEGACAGTDDGDADGDDKEARVARSSERTWREEASSDVGISD